MTDISKLMNVQYSEKYSEHRIANLRLDTPTVLRTVVWELATRNPTWRFFATDGRVVGSNLSPEERYFQATVLTVRQDDEVLGTLSHVIYRRKHCIGVGNPRIGKELDYGEIMRTSNPAKALQIAKKYFTKASVSEKVEAANKIAVNLLNNLVFTHDRRVSDLRAPIDLAVKKYIYDEGLAAFKGHLASIPTGEKTLNNLDKYFEAKEEANIVADIVTLFKQKQTCMVVLDGGTYIVKNPNESMCTYDDTDTPENVRRKIGLLKLVTAGLIIKDVGVRVADNVFVITTDEEASC